MKDIFIDINILDSIFNSLGTNTIYVYKSFLYNSLFVNVILLIIGAIFLSISLFLLKDKDMFLLERSSDPIKITITILLVLVGFVIVLCCVFDIFQIFFTPEIYFINSLLTNG